MQAQQPDSPSQTEAAYRRGIHQAIAFCGEQLWQIRDLAEARERIGRAEDIASDLRTANRDLGHGHLLDVIRERLNSKR